MGAMTEPGCKFKRPEGGPLKASPPRLAAKWLADAEFRQITAEIIEQALLP
jgi:hypothetical protein